MYFAHYVYIQRDVDREPYIYFQYIVLAAVVCIRDRQHYTKCKFINIVDLTVLGAWFSLAIVDLTVLRGWFNLTYRYIHGSLEQCNQRLFF